VRSVEGADADRLRLELRRRHNSHTSGHGSPGSPRGLHAPAWAYPPRKRRAQRSRVFPAFSHVAKNTRK